MKWIFMHAARGISVAFYATDFMKMLTVLSILLMSFQALGQTDGKRVSGRVTDETGEPLPGVTVVVEGTSKGTVTDLEGQYSILVQPEDVLVFSFVGYLNEQVPVGNQSTINLELTPDLKSLEEVVVVGYGAQKKSDVTGSLVSVGAETISEVPAAADVSNALKGRLAGVQIQSTSSRPGAETQIRIRGNRSLGSDESGVNNPLIVVDGIPYSGSMNDINPSIIESVNILKDASSTAIYGSRGANGVILITTKRGKEGKPLISYNGYYGVVSELDQYELFNAEEFADFRTVSDFQQEGGAFTAQERENILLGRGTDWQDLVLKDGHITNHELSVSGGNENTQYAISGGVFDQTTVLPGQAFERYTLRTALDQQIGERVKVGLSSLNTLSTRYGESTNPMFQLLTMSPLYNAYTPEGNINLYPAIGSLEETLVNPLTLYNENAFAEERRRLRTFNSLFGEVEILNGLSYRLNVGLDYWQEEYGQFEGSETPMRNGQASVARIRNQDTWSYTIENLLTYNNAFGDHNLNVTGLFSVQEQETNRSGLDASDIFADNIRFYNFQLAGDFTIPNDQFMYERWGLVSYMARVNYSYQDRFLATATVRRDGSSRLAEGNKWFTYPAGALGWNIMNEGFMEDVEFVSNLKLRIGAGLTSNQAIAPYSSLGRLGRTLYNFGQTGYYGFLVSELPNANLQWEFTQSYNLGIDFGFLTNRITGSVDVYQTYTDNVLQSRNLAVTSGVPGRFQQNIGETRSHGVEAMVDAIIIESLGRNEFGWSMNANFTYNRAEIAALAGGIQQDVGNAWFVNEPINVLYDYEKIGIWQLNEADEAAEFGGYVPGDVKVADNNPNGVLDPDDRTILGQLDPVYTAGLTTRFTYKGFDLTAVAFGNFGHMLVSTLYQARAGYPINTLEGRRNGPRVDYWTPDNPTNAFPRTGEQQPKFGTTLGYFDGDFAKIRSINLGYTLPEALLENIGISSTRVYLTADNPFKAFFSDYVDMGGIDPEPSGRDGNTGTPGLGRRLIVTPDTPVTRSFIFGLNLTL